LYRLIALDLDGTLLTPQHTISTRTRQVLERSISAGITIVIATGQTRAVLHAICQGIPLQGPQILYNGALIADFETGAIVDEQLVPVETIPSALSMLRDLKLYRGYHTHEHVYVDQSTPNARNWYRPPVAPVIEVADVASIYPQPCIKLAAVGAVISLREKRAILENHFAGQLYVTQSSRDLLELLHPQVSKGQALRTLAQKLQIEPSEIMAIGDNHNDIGMLQFAGLGVAMGNAHDEVKDNANIVTLSNEEDGVAVVIERILESSL
jgi:Cof subfamily protein (haloacid dehalogenase superfamily)